MADDDLIRRSAALNAVQLGDTVTKLQARISSLPAATAPEVDAMKRAISARDRRIARLVAALDDARANGYVTQAEQDPALVQSAEMEPRT